MIKNIKPLIVIFIFGILFSVIKYLKLPYSINLTSSKPIGIYHITPFEFQELNHGDIVLMEVPEPARPYIYGRGWVKEGTLLLKDVGALAGDIVSIDESKIFINSQYIGPVLDKDREGKPLPKLRGVFIVEPGQFVPISNYMPNSFDGRYFGAVSISLVKGIAKPVLVFK